MHQAPSPRHVHHTSRNPGRPGTGASTGGSPNHAHEDSTCCYQPACWPRPSSARRACRRRATRPPTDARPPRRRRRHELVRRAANSARPAPTAWIPIAVVGRRRHGLATVGHRQRRLRRRHVQQRRLARPACTRARTNLAAFCLADGKLAQHLHRQLRRRPGERPDHRRHQPLRGRELHHAQRRGLEPPGQAERQHRCSGSPASPRPIPAIPAASAGDRRRPGPRLLQRPVCSTPAVTSARSAPAPAVGQSTIVGNAAGFNRQRHADRRSPVAPTRRSSPSRSARTASGLPRWHLHHRARATARDQLAKRRPSPPAPSSRRQPRTIGAHVRSTSLADQQQTTSFVAVGPAIGGVGHRPPPASPSAANGTPSLERHQPQGRRQRRRGHRQPGLLRDVEGLRDQQRPEHWSGSTRRQAVGNGQLHAVPATTAAAGHAGRVRPGPGQQRASWPLVTSPPSAPRPTSTAWRSSPDRGAPLHHSPW